MPERELAGAAAAGAPGYEDPHGLVPKRMASPMPREADCVTIPQPLLAQPKRPTRVWCWSAAF
jgi:hypothetical protein